MQSTSFELKNEVVRAGAGAGKTTTLTRRVIAAALSHYEKHGKFPKIVVTTFTRKATQELRERLMAEASRSGNKELLSFTSSKSQLFISTIHGVLSQFLNRYGYLSKMDPGYRIESGATVFAAVKKLLREVLFETPERQQLLERFDFDRLGRMVRAYSEQRYFYSDFEPHNLESFKALYRGRTERLAGELEEVAQQILSEAETDAWREYAQGLLRGAQLLKESELSHRASQFISVLESLKKPRRTQKTPGISEELAESLKDVVDQCKRLAGEKNEDRFLNTELWPQFFSAFQNFREVAEDFHQRFHQHKMNSGQMEMNDLESFSWKLLQEHPEAAKQFVAEWDYWLIDEYQDTSPVQVNLLKKLVGNRPSFTVGDPQQSIYIFRGAHSELFAEREKELEAEGLEVGFLKKNYRSDPALLEFFNDFFTRLGPQFSRMEPKEGEASTLNGLPVATFSICRDEQSDDEFSEEFIALTNHLHRLIEAGCRLDQICILGRTNRRLEKVSLSLTQLGYPVHLHSSSGFYSRREVLDAMSFLKFLANPHDDQNLVQLLRSPWFRVSDSQLVELCAAKSQERSLWVAISSVKSDGSAFEVISYLAGMLSYAAEYGYSLAFEQALDKCGLFDWCRHVDATGRRESNLWKLVAKLFDAERTPGFNLNEFIDSPIRQQSVDEGGEETDAVAALEPNRINLMTVHASKGLQFDHVLLTELHRSARLSTAVDFSVSESGQWCVPLFSEEDHTYIHSIAAVEGAQALRERETLEQERLLYVALTRAKKSVYLSWQQSTQRNSLAQMIRWDLSPGEHKNEKYTYFVQKEDFQLCEYSAEEETGVRVRPLYQIESGKAKSQKVDSISVSQLLQMKYQATPENEVADDKTSDSFRLHEFIPGLLKTREGVRVHRLFELLRYVPTAQFQSTVESWRKENATMAEAFDFVQALDEPPMHRLLREGFVEWGFVCKFEHYFMEGQIDLWGVVDGRLWLVDYKTGNPAYVEKAFRQLALYAHALRKSGRQEEITAAVIYPMEGKVFCRPQEQLLQELSDIRSFVQNADS